MELQHIDIACLSVSPTNMRGVKKAEPHDDIAFAIAREKVLKAWKREWKIRLVEESNPDWRDISDLIL